MECYAKGLRSKFRSNPDVKCPANCACAYRRRALLCASTQYSFRSQPKHYFVGQLRQLLTFTANSESFVFYQVGDYAIIQSWVDNSIKCKLRCVVYLLEVWYLSSIYVCTKQWAAFLFYLYKLFYVYCYSRCRVTLRTLKDVMWMWIYLGITTVSLLPR